MNKKFKMHLGIAVFGFDRADLIQLVLSSLQKQEALQHVHVWIDGFQGNRNLFKKTEAVYQEAKQFPVNKIHRHRGHLGFRKMMLNAMHYMSENYHHLIFLEDDCFPTIDAITVFREELDLIAEQPEIFSVYGHHFLIPEEGETIGRFQGWGWATTSRKLSPLLDDLVHYYLMGEEQYLEFTKRALTDEILQVIDVTPGRQPSLTLRSFFAWDETLCLLCGQKGLKHKKTRKRVVYNCGVGKKSTHFSRVEYYCRPPFNMILPKDVWKVFDGGDFDPLSYRRLYRKIFNLFRRVINIRARE